MEDGLQAIDPPSEPVRGAKAEVPAVFPLGDMGVMVWSGVELVAAVVPQARVVTIHWQHMDGHNDHKDYRLSQTVVKDDSGSKQLQRAVDGWST